MSKRIYHIILFLIAYYVLPVSSRAQLPVTNVIYSKRVAGIKNFNPYLPVSSTNPVANSIALPSTDCFGLAISPVLGSGSSTLTFYTMDPYSFSYLYYNPATSAWVNTGHSIAAYGTYACMAAGGGYIYSMHLTTGAVYKYDGTGSAVLLVTVPGFTGYPKDLEVDCKGNFYVLSEGGSAPFLKKYNPSGTLLKTWVVYNPLGISISGFADGFSIVGSSLYVTDGTTDTRKYTIGADTITMVSKTTIGTLFNGDDWACSSVPVISGSLNACLGQTSTLTSSDIPDAITPWKSSDTGIAKISNTGVVTTFAAGTATITFTNVNGCTQTSTFTVNPLPTISGTLSACAGQTVTLSGSASPATVLPWTSSNTAVATVSATGVVTALSAGTTTITYKNSNGCIKTATFTVNGPSVVSPVNYCLGAPASALSATKSSASDTLYWYTSATGGAGTTTAPIPSTATPGTVNYYVSEKTPGGCESSRILISVYTAPANNPFQITTNDSVLCTGKSTSLFVPAANDSLNSRRPYMYVNPAMIFNVVGKSAITINGIDLDVYDLTATDSVAVYYKKGSFVGYENSSAGWTLIEKGPMIEKGSSSAGIATTIATPFAINIKAGDTIAFYVTNLESSYNLSLSDPVTSLNHVVVEDDNLQMLQGSYSGWNFDYWGGGDPYTFLGQLRYKKFDVLWSTGSTADSINVSPTLTTNYWAKLSNWIGCSVSDTIKVLVNPPVLGTLTACIGDTVMLKVAGKPDATTPWTSSAPGVATISSTGVVSALSAGTTTITYKNTNGCTQTATFTVNALPTISGTLSACAGQMATLSGSASPDATTPWTSSAPGVATISSTGVVSALSAGTTTITYKNTNGCTQTATFTVNALPTISGTLSACAGQTATLTGSASPDATTPWTSSATGVATISSTGVVSALSAGTTTITYKNTNGCTQTAIFTVNPLPVISGTLNACVGKTSMLTGSASPDATTPWTSSTPGVATVSGSGVVTAIASGTTTITYKNNNGCTQTATFTVNALPTISGTLSACAGQMATLSGSASPDATTPWTSSAPGVATISSTGVVSALSAGTTTITYKNTNGCTQTATFTVNALPTISGTLSACAGQTVTLSGSVSPDATTPWISSAPGVATISSTGVVSALSAGTTTITYKNTNGCTQTATFTVNPLPVISGTLNACAGQTATLTGSASPDATTPWISSAPGVATISSTGVVSALSAGTTTITYKNTNGCTQTATFMVNPLPIISGTLSACAGQTATLIGSASPDATTSWTSSTPGVATVSGSGVVTAIASGTTTITYKNNNGCTQTATFTVNPLPVISGTLNACAGQTATLTGSASPDATTPWTSSAPGVATISSTGVVSALSAGTTTIIYKNTNGCTQTATFTVNPLPVISGTLNACVGKTSMLTGSASPDATTPWISSATAVATISNTGVVTAVASGTTTITYKNSNGCTQTATFTVNALPTISGTLSACAGQTATLSGSAIPDATTPWTSSNTSVAAVSGTGVVSAVSAGTTTITYKNTNGCTQTATFTVNPLPTISGTLSACAGQTATLSGSAIPDATTPWTSSNTSVAAVSGTGVVSAVSAGTTTITYKNTNGCTQTATFTVNPLPVISGTLSACAGQTVTLTGSASPDATTPWTSSNTSVATVSGTGLVSAVSAGTTTITYKNTNGCTQTATFTVNPLPAISGALNACVGKTATLSGSASPDATTPWVSSNTAVATISNTGVVTAVASGTTTITYKNTNGCTQTATFTVNALPVAPTVVSPLNLCVGATALPLTATGTNLKWYTVATGGTSVTSVTPGTAVAGTTTYYVSQVSDVSAGGCEGPRTALTVIVNPLPVAPSVLTPLNLCIGVPASPLTATGINLKWYLTGSSTVAVPTPTPSTDATGATTYYVSQTSLVGCEGPRAAIVVNVRPAPTLTITPVGVPGFVFCDSRKVTIKAVAPAATSFQWSTAGSIITGATYDTLNVGTAGYYAMKVSSIYGCITQDSVLVTSNPLPAPTLSPTEIQFCEGVEIMLYCKPASAGYIYEWMKDGIAMPVATTIFNTPVSAKATYTVRVTDIYTCVKTTNAATLFTYPGLTKPSIIRTGSVLRLSKPYLSYQWYRNKVAIPGATGISYTTMFDGAYYAKVSDEYCAVNSDTVIVNSLSIKGISANNAQIRIYPNPTSGIVHIEAPVKINVIVTDVVGKIILNKIDVSAVDLSAYADGTYFFRILDEENQLISVEKIDKISMDR